MAKNSLRKSQWIALLSTPALGLLAYILTFYLDPLHVKGTSAAAAIPAALLAIVILLIGQMITTFREVERVSDGSDRIYEAVRDYLHVTKVGTPRQAWAYALGRLPILEEVRNTSFNIRDELERADERLYDSTEYLTSPAEITRWTERELRWKDIGDSEALPRLKRIDEKSEVGRQPGHYEYRVIAHIEPQMNFMLLSYGDGSTEVLFNWDFRNIAQDPVVLLSRDRDIVSMFATQFEHLWRHAVTPHDKTATKSTSKK